MRNKLEKYMGKKIRIQAIFKRFGTKKNWNGYPEKTICLGDIRKAENKEKLTDHLWFTCGKKFDRLNLQEGDVVEFFGTISVYSKGYHHDSYDYKITYPSKILKKEGIK